MSQPSCKSYWTRNADCRTCPAPQARAETHRGLNCDFAFLQCQTLSPCMNLHSFHVPDSLLISSSFPCNRSFGDRKNSSFLFRLDCLFCLINSSMVIYIFVGQDKIHVQKFSLQQWSNSKLFTKLDLAFVIHPRKWLPQHFSYPQRWWDCEYLLTKDI